MTFPAKRYKILVLVCPAALYRVDVMNVQLAFRCIMAEFTGELIPFQDSRLDQLEFEPLGYYILMHRLDQYDPPRHTFAFPTSNRM